MWMQRHGYQMPEALGDRGKTRALRAGLWFSAKDIRMRDFFYDFFIPSLMVLALMAVSFGISVGFDAYKCASYETVTGKKTRFKALSCYVQDTGNWYAWAEYKHRLATKGEFSK